MKKLISIIIGLALTLSLCSFCVAEAHDLTGEWYASVFGISLTLVVNEDGTCSMLFPGEEPSEGSWVVEGDQFIVNKGQEDETIATISEGALTISEDGLTMEFTREPVAAIELAAVVAAENISDFDGTYEASLMVIPMGDENMIIDMNDAIEQGSGELIGVTEDLSMVIEDGSVTAFGQNAQTFSFADGKLNIPSPDAETPALEQNIELLEDGSIAYTLTVFQIIFTAVTLAE